MVAKSGVRIYIGICSIWAEKREGILHKEGKKARPLALQEWLAWNSYSHVSFVMSGIVSYLLLRSDLPDL